MSLSQLNIGQVGYVDSIGDVDPQLRRRLLDLGFIKNSKISLMNKTFGIRSYKIKETQIALRLEDANRIHIRL